MLMYKISTMLLRMTELGDVDTIVRKKGSRCFV